MYRSPDLILGYKYQTLQHEFQFELPKRSFHDLRVLLSHILIWRALDGRIPIKHRMIAGQDVTRIAAARVRMMAVTARFVCSRGKPAHTRTPMSLWIFILRGIADGFSDNFLLCVSGVSDEPTSGTLPVDEDRAPFLVLLLDFDHLLTEPEKKRNDVITTENFLTNLNTIVLNRSSVITANIMRFYVFIIVKNLPECPNVHPISYLVII